MELMEIRRRLLMQRVDSIPMAYTKIEWIQSNVGAYIDTDIPITDDLVLVVDFQLTNTTARYYFMGDYDNNDGRFMLYTGVGNIFQMAYGGGWINTSLSLDTNRHSFEFSIENGKSIARENNAEIAKTNRLSTLPTNGILIAGTKLAHPLSVITYGVKMMKSGTAIRKFVPCVRKSDGKPGMYDTVSKVFYTSAGSGEFIVPA